MSRREQPADEFLEQAMQCFFLPREKNSILRTNENTFYIMNAKNVRSRRYYLAVGDFTIFSCKKDVYTDLNTILEMLGLRTLSRDEYDQLTEKMKQHEREYLYLYRAVRHEPLPFENDFLVTGVKQ